MLPYSAIDALGVGLRTATRYVQQRAGMSLVIRSAGQEGRADRRDISTGKRRWYTEPKELDERGRGAGGHALEEGFICRGVLGTGGRLSECRRSRWLERSGWENGSRTTPGRGEPTGWRRRSVTCGRVRERRGHTRGEAWVRACVVRAKKMRGCCGRTLVVETHGRPARKKL